MLPYPIIETIEHRRSVRTYDDRNVAPETIEKIKDYIQCLTNPFGAEVKIGLVHKSFDGDSEKLGTYGVIKGAKTFLGLSVAPGEKALLGAGYQFENLILYATSLGLGTVWLAATFTRNRFQTALGIPDNYLFPAISPIGYPLEKRLFERIMRKTIGADKRKSWRELFFNGNFTTPLSESEAGKYVTAFEMLRLAPSATNAQPWRVLMDGNTFHFFESHKDSASKDDVLIKQVDLGIGIFHFTQTLQSQGINGTFADIKPTEAPIPPTYHYVISYVTA